MKIYTLNYLNQLKYVGEFEDVAAYHNSLNSVAAPYKNGDITQVIDENTAEQWLNVLNPTLLEEDPRTHSHTPTDATSYNYGLEVYKDGEFVDIVTSIDAKTSMDAHMIAIVRSAGIDDSQAHQVRGNPARGYYWNGSTYRVRTLFRK